LLSRISSADLTVFESEDSRRRFEASLLMFRQYL
jgi:hypothetical protein